ncbi:N,N-dimethylformamidase beta subunit family domain-containing protein [Hyphomicrobium sp. 99]|uniref:N,N-dimethylformamidase beta subunit family domain-containing protein n=1 Tax=Hyphomicrobium sp. 99 TaxID=1163419 RepID=UPI0018CFD588|nr:N,N-dimethylformamidase beta subunit family domain-containing protein [Hyphomicrobium sp. 99]
MTRPALEREIEGYASACSVSAGETIQFYVNTEAPSYAIEIFRMGWYDGRGARQVWGPVSARGVRQSIPAPDPDTGLVDCDWQEPFKLDVRSNWLSGVYLAKLEEITFRRQSYIIFVVRKDNDNADIVYQLPVNTYQVYNFWGGKSGYEWGSGGELPWGSSAGRPAVVVSFNRPYARSTNPAAAALGMGAGEFLSNVQPVREGYPISSAGWDYNTVRWLEREGYYVTYITNVDSHNLPDAVSRRRVFIAGAHDEYWSLESRTNIEKALSNGTCLIFSGANAVYWQVRQEKDRKGRPCRFLAIYKESAAASDPVLIDGDPSNDHLATTNWREAPVSQPEDKLIGISYLMDPVDGNIVITNPSHWAFENTGLREGSELVGLLGYEVDGVTSHAPEGLVVLATSPAQNLYDPKRSVVANMATYAVPSGGQVFATGSIQWCWGLDDFNVPELRTSRLNDAAAQITHNVLTRFGARRYSS